MINTNTIIKELQNNKNGLIVNGKSYIYEIGKIPIILSAPHVVKQYRESQVKSFDLLIDNGNEYLKGQVTRQCSLVTNAFQIELKKKIRTLRLKNYYLLKSFIYSMEKSIYETYDFSMKLEKVRRDGR